MTKVPPEYRSRPWGRFILGCIIFGVLMGSSRRADSIGVSAALAGCAFVDRLLDVIDDYGERANDT